MPICEILVLFHIQYNSVLHLAHWKGNVSGAYCSQFIPCAQLSYTMKFSTSDVVQMHIMSLQLNNIIM